MRLSFAIVAAASMTAAGLVFTSSSAYADTSTPSSYVVFDLNNPVASVVAEAVQLVGGTVVQSLGADGEIEANLTPFEVFLLGVLPGMEVVPNISISLQSAGFSTDASQTPGAVFAQQTGATQLWAKKDTGKGVNVAVLDTGISSLPDFAGRLVGGVDLSGAGNPFEDSYGHGTFVAGLIAGSGSSSGGQYTGEAPGAGLVSVKVAGASGSTNLATVIAGVGWTIAHAKSLNIRVLNMSLGFVPWESTSLNPLDQAVQQAWESGIVVVTSAGNAGPFNGTVLSPGDDPYVITVGALNDLGQTNPALDTMTTFSSSGPTTPDGFYKPDLVASGRSVVSLADPGSTVYSQNPSARVGSANFVGSGTSFSTAITSGAVALDLALNPKDKPDDVKARLLATALRGPSGNPFVDGHGDLDIAAAVLNNGVHLTQPYGYLDIQGPMQNGMQITPGDTLSAGYAMSMPGKHASAIVRFVQPAVTVPVSCTKGGTVAGQIVVNLASGPYSIAPNINSVVPTSQQSSPSSFQGSATAPGLCSGAPMYDVGGATLTGQALSTDPLDRLNLQFHFLDIRSTTNAGWSPTATVNPVSPVGQGTTVGLSTPWGASTWDAANWNGLQSPSPGTTSPPASGLDWNGSAWNGSAWNGSAWNGSTWNGSAWNGSAWNGSAWNGSAWNGSAWNGSAWNGSAWNGAEWG